MNGRLAAALLLGTLCCCADAMEAYFKEPSESEFFGVPARSSPDRLTDVSTEQFEALLREGKPVIVTDAARDWKMKGWSCQSIQAEFAKNVDKRRGDAVPYLQYASKDGDGMKFANTKDDAWMKEVHPSGEKDNAAPRLAPTYWGVKDGHPNSPSRKAIAKSTKLPYFLRSTPGNEVVFSSPEFWFSVPGAGAKAHQDSHCQGTMSITLGGKKRWRLSPMPAVHTVATTVPIHDGSINASVWTPTYEFELGPGEGVFFPSGFVHETNNVGDECSASVTYQFDYPSPSKYLRAFLPRLLTAPNMQECRIQQQYVTSGGIALGQHVTTDPSEQTARSSAEAIFSKYDSNGDGRLTKDELRAAVAAERRDKQQIEEILHNSFGYHDLTARGWIERDDFVQSYVRYWTVERFASHARVAMSNYRHERAGLKCVKCGKTCKGVLIDAEQWIREQLRLPDQAGDPTFKLSKKCAHMPEQYLELLKSTQLPGATDAEPWLYVGGRQTATDSDEFEELEEPGVGGVGHGGSDDEDDHAHHDGREL